MNDKKRILSFDIMKTISIFLVIFAHFGRVNTNICTGELNRYINYFFATLATYAVPLFFMINGALLLKEPQKNSFRKMYGKAFHFFVIRVFYCVVGIFAEMVFLGESYSRKEFMDAMVNSPCDPFTFLWFLDALIGIYLIVPFICKMAMYDRKTYIYLASFIFLFSIVPYTYDHTINIIFERYLGMSYSLADVVKPFYLIGSYYSYTLFYFLAGAVIYEYRDNITKKVHPGALAVIAIGLFGCWYLFCCWQTLINAKIYESMWNGYSTVFIAVSAASIYLLFINLKYQPTAWWHNTVSLFSSNTLGIYLLEGFVAVPYYYFLKTIDFNVCDVPLLNTIFITVICLCLSIGIKKIPVLRRMV